MAGEAAVAEAQKKLANTKITEQAEKLESGAPVTESEAKYYA